MKKLLTGIEWLEELDKKYPNRHKQIHKACCRYCPTNNNNNGITDLECEEIKAYPKHIIATEFLFVCAWRTSKLCKGICDYYEIDEKYIQENTKL